MRRRKVAGVLIACMVVVFPAASLGKEVQGAAKRPFLLPPGMRQPERICEPIGNIVSPDRKWLVFLRRAEWDERGYRIPYMLTEVWVRDRKTGKERRVLDYRRLSSKWVRRLGRKETTFRAAGGFTFRYVQWSPSSKALALDDAGDEEVCWGSVVIDLERNPVMELEGRGLRWSPDGTMLAGCSGGAHGCPDGFLMVDLRSGQVKHHFAGVDMGGTKFGWHSPTEYAFVAFLNGRGGWWKYEPAKGEATLAPLDVEPTSLRQPTPPTQTWWPLKGRRYRGCEH